MRKYFILLGVILSVLVFANCNSTKKLAKAIPKSTYTTDLSLVIMDNCVPCHIPAKGGRKKSYDNYENVKTDIDEIIRRIELKPGEKDFMPFKKTSQLPDTTIAKFKKWRDDGLLEK
jgi:uncharacterized membrane protein